MNSLDPRDWNSIRPHFRTLEHQDLNSANVEAWLQTWSDLEAQIYEAHSRSYRAKMEDTTNQAAESDYLDSIENILPPVSIAANKLTQKLLAFGDYQPTDQTQELLRRVHAEAKIFREQNVPLKTELGKLEVEYDKIVGSLEIEFEGQRITFYAANAKLELPDRTLRERVFRQMVAAWAVVRDELDLIFLKMLPLRRQIAKNAGFQDYRQYIWLEKNRFDYSPEDSQELHQIVLDSVVPVATNLARERAQKLKLETVKPWDVYVSFDGLPSLKPFEDVIELESKISSMFHALDPELGVQFDTLREQDLDLDSRAGKGPGGYCDFFPASGKAYIFMNAVGTHDDVQTMLHEGGHAFHALESFNHQNLHWNYHGPMEFCEVASMGMELLASPYLERDRGGFYTPDDANRARVSHLRNSAIQFLPYMAVVDAFQHWLYVDAPEDTGIAQIHAKWAELHQKFIPSIDFSGIEDALSMRWQLQSHIFTAPFYYIEYGIAQLGALQLWQNSLEKPRETVQQYRHALGLGYTKGLAQLFAAAGIKLPFDAPVVKGLMTFVSKHLELEKP
jgi:oligoendopeptidase F